MDWKTKAKEAYLLDKNAKSIREREEAERRAAEEARELRKRLDLALERVFGSNVPEGGMVTYAGEAANKCEISGIFVRAVVVKNEGSCLKVRGECPSCKEVAWSVPVHNLIELGGILTAFVADSSEHHCGEESK